MGDLGFWRKEGRVLVRDICTSSGLKRSEKKECWWKLEGCVESFQLTQFIGKLQSCSQN